MPQDHDQGDAQFQDPVRDACQDRLVQDLAGRAHGQQITQALVEDQLRRHPGIDAAQDHGEGMLPGDQRLPYRARPVGMPLMERPPAPVPCREFPQRGLRRGRPRAV